MLNTSHRRSDAKSASNGQRGNEHVMSCLDSLLHMYMCGMCEACQEVLSTDPAMEKGKLSMGVRPIIPQSKNENQLTLLGRIIYPLNYLVSYRTKETFIFLLLFYLRGIIGQALVQTQKTIKTTDLRLGGRGTFREHLVNIQ